MCVGLDAPNVLTKLKMRTKNSFSLINKLKFWMTEENYFQLILTFFISNFDIILNPGNMYHLYKTYIYRVFALGVTDYKVP